MTNRREFLQIGIAASALPFASQAARAAGIAQPELADSDVLPLYKVIYDLRFADSVAFARRAETLGMVVHAIEGDMTRFWFDDLHHRWRRGPAAIAGLTAHGPLFCLERLAWDQGMRVVFRAEHNFATASCVEHSFAGPVAMLQASGDLSAGERWGARMADVVTQCPSGRSEIARAQGQTAVSRAIAPDTESLFSWVIAPASKA
ncbi:MAG TPA: hypothetical protein VJA26_18345 [Gammaproteobacteria bacterium]|nr:hypothetical protein [Gammaproteobacteria bacterium]